MADAWDSDDDGIIDGLDEQEQAEVAAAEQAAGRIRTYTPNSEKLNSYSVMSIIINRMIGTGIFSTPASVYKTTGSVGLSMLLQLAGFLISLCGLLIYLEFGLSLPQYKIRNNIVSIPRSGGEKVYLELIFRVPKRLTSCVYGLVFIILGNTATNSIVFARFCLISSGKNSEWIENRDQWPLIKGLAVATVTLACLLHGTWRRGGIWVNNSFAVLKLGTLLVMIIAGFVYMGGSLGPKKGEPTDNFSTKNSFSAPNLGFSVYSQSLSWIMFSYAGYENGNYVLGEIRRPKQTFAKNALISFLTVSILYFLTNIVYFGVVSKEEFIDLESGSILAMVFFKKIFDSETASRVMAAFIALSAFGNIIVVTFVNSRVKQEIAKEGILPFSHLFASEWITPASRLSARLSRNKTQARPNPTPMEERTPVPALFLHWLFSVVLIVASPVKTAFEFLSLLYTYSTHIWMGVFLGVGLLYLLYKPGSTWVRPLGLPPLLGKNWGRRESTLYAFFFTATNIFLVFAPWVPAAALTGAKFMKGHPLDGLPWYLYPTLGTGILFAGGLYWVGFEIIYPKYKHMELKVQRIPVVDLVDEVQVRELVFFKWLPSGADGDSE